jgi:hypothetical protein
MWSLRAAIAALEAAAASTRRPGRRRYELMRKAAQTAATDEIEAHAVLLRDIFGNPFREVNFEAEWRTTTVVALAMQLYETRDFGEMPILADAIQDAGCEDTVILDHCRGPGPHVRGCWVCDLVLGME